MLETRSNKCPKHAEVFFLNAQKLTRPKCPKHVQTRCDLVLEYTQSFAQNWCFQRYFYRISGRVAIGRKMFTDPIEQVNF
jgi:hypothetical protein